MPQIFEARRENYTISTDPARIDVDAIADMLSRSYWASTRPRSQLERALQNSLVFSLYHGTQQIGLARVITDFSIFAYLCDVILHEDYRGKGLGRWLMETAHSHPDLQGLRRWMLTTDNAHDLYSQFGYTVLEQPERWMMKFNG